MTEALLNKLVPYSPDFPDALREYCEKAADAIRENKHHDHRRHLFISFLGRGLGIKVDEIELERKIKAGSVRGRIDAFYRECIIEFKTDLERERDDAKRELTKYFEAQKHPLDFVGIVSDGLQFEVYLYESGAVKQITGFELEPGQPLIAFRHLDQLLFTGKLLLPTSGDIISRFGSASAVFSASMRLLRELYASVANDSAVKIKFREWNALLAKVYGSALGNEDLFLKHTYLTMVSRVIVTMTLFPKSRRSKMHFRGIVDGEFFKNQNIKNLAEPDFFSWSLDTRAENGFLEFISGIFSRLDVYNFDKLSEDVLKELYQELVDPVSRHDLGEYYTPDWLAELTLDQINYRGGRLLDPACGSGTFLFAAVHRLRAQKMIGQKLVEHVLDSIIGIDVHPLAILMAKANLLLALRNELETYGHDVYLPVYMADTLMTGEDRTRKVHTVVVSEKEIFHLPFRTIERGGLDALIDRLCLFAKKGVASEKAAGAATEGVSKWFEGFEEHERMYWVANFRLMMKLEKTRRNSIWGYILKNAYRPAYLRREQADYIVGNPPWLAYRYIKDKGYQRRVKELTFDYELLEKTDVKLFTQMDASTLFFVHCANQFLKPTGTIAFVMPKSVIVPAKQHANFQTLGFSQIHDFTDVEPLFKVRTCVLVRDSDAVKKQIPVTLWSGKLSHRNCNLRDALKELKPEQDKLSFVAVGQTLSPYYDSFVQGATLVPRCFWFVATPDDGPLNVETPYLATSVEAFKECKPEWRLKMEGLVERNFLFGTVLAKDLIPFVVRKLCLVVLPVKENRDGDLLMVSPSQILHDGFPHSSEWIEKAEKIWDKKRKDENLTIFERLNYNKLLTNQEFASDFVVLYNTSGSNISAALLTPKETKHLGKLSIEGFIAESVTYHYVTETENEALYLVGILNSAIVNEIIKPYQPQGLMGERHIHRRPFEYCPIPLFDPANETHQQIAVLARQAREELLPIVRKMTAPVATARAEARRLVAGKLDQINKLVKRLFADAKFTAPTKKTSSSNQPELLK
jgi:methylase of polypeptide subunit release factors